MKTNANKGMYLESLINNSIHYYESHKIAIIRKQWVPIKIHHINGTNIKASLSHKCDVDYYGCYQGKFFAFEAKQCLGNSFATNRLSINQINFLNLVNELNGFSFLIFGFKTYNKFIFVDWNEYCLNSDKEKYLKLEWFEKHGIELKIQFPGLLDIISIVKAHYQ
ncbi:MAG: Holliday junction resolvase RecU [Ureaplasma sp.]|nr:Holliday junction resolvase RecU [Ureaplasma sp.]